jgi:hypothetical protein
MATLISYSFPFIPSRVDPRDDERQGAVGEGRDVQIGSYELA